MTASHDRAPILTQIARNLHEQLDNPTLANSPVIKEVLASQERKTASANKSSSAND